MKNSSRRFSVSLDEENFKIGTLDGEKSRGAYLSADYLDRLNDVVSAARLRLNSSDDADAIKNLLGILERLHVTYLRAGAEHDEASLHLAQNQLSEAMNRLHGLDTDPDRA